MTEEKDTHALEQETGSTKRSPWWKRLWTWTKFGQKSGWEWLELLSALAIPVVIAIAGYWFSAQQDARQQDLETQRARAEQKLQDQRAQDAALQAYISGIGDLLLNERLADPQGSRNVHILARARTLTILGRLGSERKAHVMQFLYENGLISTYEEAVPVPSEGEAPVYEDVEKRDEPIVDLSDADLSSIDLGDGVLNDAYLRWVNMSDANLSHDSLVATDFSYSNLKDANLKDASMFGAVLEGTDLRGADLRGADLSEADLTGADLSGADLTSADLTSADLATAKGVTKKDLERFTNSLEGTIMPDGTIKAGRYVTKEFDPPLSFTLSDGWQLTDLEKSDAIFMQGPEGGELIFASPVEAFDRSKPSEPEIVPAPEDAEEWISWFREHPSLDTTDSVQIPVADVPGVLIVVTKSSPPEDYSKDHCGPSPCVPLFLIGGEDVFGTKVGGSEVVSYPEARDGFVIADVDGKTLIINVAAPADKFEKFAPEAVKVLETVTSESLKSSLEEFEGLSL